MRDLIQIVETHGRPQYLYVTNCTDFSLHGRYGEAIHEMTDQAEDIDFADLVQAVGWQGLEGVFGHEAHDLENDFAVSYHKSVWRGIPCFYVQHSRIEYIFTLDGKMPEGDWVDVSDDLEEHASVISETAEYGGYFHDDNMEPVWDLRSPRDLKYALRRTGKNGELRGLVDDDHVIAWDSWKEVHAGVIEEFNSYNEQYGDEEGFQPLRTEWKAMIYLYEDGVAMAPKRSGSISYVANHPILKAIYGGEVPLREPRR
jgi:hypothetical protein